MKLQSDAQILEGATMVLNNTEKDANIQKGMEGYGFTKKRMKEGDALLNNVLSLQAVCETHHNERWAISQKLEADRNTALALFKDHVGVARIALRNDPVVLHSLKIQRISKKTWGWPRQALHFYEKVTPHLAQLEALGVNAEVLAQAKASVQALLALKEDRLLKKSKVEDSTQEKRKAMKALKAWVQEFISIARIAFKDNPQTLEAFGIVVAAKV